MPTGIWPVKAGNARHRYSAGQDAGWTYFAGKNPDASARPLSPGGTAFQQAVWQELRKIPYGETESYGAVAARLGSSARAVGSAVGRNPISLIIPCHRVLAADGGLTGYAGGLENKKKLLRLEGQSV